MSHLHLYSLKGTNSCPTSILTTYCPYILENVQYKNITYKKYDENTSEILNASDL